MRRACRGSARPGAWPPVTDGRRRPAARLPVPCEERGEVDVDQLVAVQRVHRARLPAELRRELDAAAAAEALLLFGDRDHCAEACEVTLELLALAGCTRHDHPS